MKRVNIVVPDAKPGYGDAPWYGPALLKQYLDRVAEVELTDKVDPNVDINCISCRFVANEFVYFREITKALDYDTDVVVGGMLPTHLPKHYAFDDVISIPGWGELKLRAYVKGQDYQNAGELSFCPGLDRSILRKFYTHEHSPYKEITASLLTTRGCAFNCPYCGQLTPGQKIRKTPPDEIAAQITNLTQNYGVERVVIWDDNFYLSNAHASRIVDCHPDLPEKVDIAMRANKITEESIKLLKQLNTYSIVIGVESVDPALISYMKPQVNMNHVYESIKLCEANDIKLCIGLMMGYPKETEESMDLMELFIRNYASENVRMDVAMTIPYPGTNFEKVEKANGFEPSDTWYQPQYSEGVTPYMKSIVIPLDIFEEKATAIRAAEKEAGKLINWEH